MLALLTVLSPNAHAYVFWGNPKITITVERSEADLMAGLAKLVGVRIVNCNGSFTDHIVNKKINPVAGWSKFIAGGDFCTVKVIWGTDGVVWNNSFELTSNASQHVVSIDAPVSSAPWTPFVVTSGSHTGSNPDVVVDIQ